MSDEPPERPVDTRFGRLSPRLIAFLVIAVGIALRLQSVGVWWLNPDEGIYFSLVTRSTFAGFWSEVTANAHPPLYYLILRGLGSLSLDLAWLRGFSLLAGGVAIAAAWAVGRELGGYDRPGIVAGTVAAMIVAASPGLVELSQVMRPYTLLVALLLGALYFLLRYQRLPTLQGGMALAIVASLAVLTHYSAALALAALGLLVVQDGVQRGFARRDWAGSAVALGVPILLFVGLWAFHVRPLADSSLADDALNGWLSPYMIDHPIDAWLGLLGFHSLMVGDWLRGPFVLMLLAIPFVAAGGRAPTAAVLVLAPLAIAISAASLGVYPLGSTRHSAWLIAFLAPAVGWLGSRAVLLRGPWPVALAGTTALLLALGGPVGSALGAARAPWAPADQILRRDDLGRLIGTMDPTAGPELILMSAQTFYLLLPLYPIAREGAEFSSDSSVFHFRYGERRILSTSAWDFTAGPDPEAPAHIAGILRRAGRSFPELRIDERSEATLMVGGWRPPLIDQLVAPTLPEPTVELMGVVSGLFAFRVDMPALRRVYGTDGADVTSASR